MGAALPVDREESGETGKEQSGVYGMGSRARGGACPAQEAATSPLQSPLYFWIMYALTYSGRGGAGKATLPTKYHLSYSLVKSEIPSF